MLGFARFTDYFSNLERFLWIVGFYNDNHRFVFGLLYDFVEKLVEIGVLGAGKLLHLLYRDGIEVFG